MPDEPPSKKMAVDDPGPSHSDQWSEWLLRRRHGGDPGHEPNVRSMVERIRDRVLDGAGLQLGMVLVDVGSGDGLIAFGAFERVGPSLKAILVDVSKPLLAHAEQRAIEAGVRDRCVFLETSAELLDGVADDSADVVTTRAVLAYVANKEAAFRRFLRVLKPHGRLSIAEPINRDEAVNVAAFASFLQSPAADKVSPPVRLMHRCRQAQLPATLEEIAKDPVTNFSERDLVAMAQKAGFDEIHMELHIDVLRYPAVAWDTYIDMAPRPGTPTLREVFTTHLTGPEQKQLEASLRPLVETGKHRTRETTAYLTASKSIF
jgi:ubiquinone/menaquinone biosynthesis C-methylase UbiE